MKFNTTIFGILILSPIGLFGQPLWIKSDEGLAAKFPTEPKKVEVVANSTTGYAYQSVDKFSQGGILYSISIIKGRPEGVRKSFLENSHEEFVKSMSDKIVFSKEELGKFGDGRFKLNYRFIFVVGNDLLTAEGFWVLDENRVIRVGVVLAGIIPENELIRSSRFLESFMLLK